MNILMLDSTKLGLYKDRVEDWEKGKMIAPVTVDMALTRACNYRCVYCYGQLQSNNGDGGIPRDRAMDFLEDCAEIGVKGVSLVSDGESTVSHYWDHFIMRGKELGLAMALGTHGYLLKEVELENTLPCLSYLRFNISAADSKSYSRIHGVPEHAFKRVMNNIHNAVRIKHRSNLPVTIGLQMVLMPEFKDQILPLASLAVDSNVDYLVIKHCSDDENGSLGVDYDKYPQLYDTLKQAESLSTGNTAIVVKWSKLREGNRRTYSRCYGPPFLLQVSGSGLVAPCGMLFNDRYSRYHMGDITKARFRDIVKSDRYWEVIRELASDKFDARTMCGCLCLQHSVNKVLDGVVNRGKELTPVDNRVIHKEFV